MNSALPKSDVPFELSPLPGPFGAEVRGIDLSKPFDDGVRDAILDAFNTNHFLVFRDQALDKPAQVVFSERFGILEPHVNRDFRSQDFPHLHPVNNLGQDGKPSSALMNRGNYFWHTDKSYMAIPSMATILHAVELPPDGGDTEFADMEAAYAALPDETKQRIEGLRMIHSWERSRQKSGSKPATADEITDAPPVSHPLVRRHPATGNKSLYIGTHAYYVEGWDVAEGEKLLDELQTFATQPQFIYRHKWLPGDMVMWDNRALLHRATSSYDMDRHKRILNRTVVRGDVPV